MVNQYYFYAVHADFGPFFLKYSSYFPYGAKLCFRTAMNISNVNSPRRASATRNWPTAS